MIKKICIVVDYPDRDLPGLLYLLSKLKKKNVFYYLVPFYNFREIYIIRPHLVILNHSRNIYTNFITILNILNINILILDTEGGMVTKDLVNEYITFSNLLKNINKICGYCIWSKQIKVNLLKILKLDPKKLIVTGNPRFPFIRLNKKKLGKNILINLNFSTINPRFQNFEQEKKLLLHQGKSMKWINGYSKHQKLIRDKFIFLIYKISQKFPQTDIIVRPHPYENDYFYRVIFKNNNNVSISTNKTIYDDINESFVVIQNNCGTAIDANLLNRTVLSYNPIKSKYLDQKFILSISQLCKSYKTIIKKIKFYKNNNYLKNKNIRLINNNFSSLNDNSKVFDKLIETYTHNKIKNISLFYLLVKNNELFYFCKALLKILLGKNLINIFNNNFKIKIFDEHIVRNSIFKMYFIIKKKNTLKLKIKREMVFFKILKFYTIKLNLS